MSPKSLPSTPCHCVGASMVSDLSVMPHSGEIAILHTAKATKFDFLKVAKYVLGSRPNLDKLCITDEAQECESLSLHGALLFRCTEKYAKINALNYVALAVCEIAISPLCVDCGIPEAAGRSSNLVYDSISKIVGAFPGPLGPN